MDAGAEGRLVVGLEGGLPVGHLLQRLDRLPERRPLHAGKVLEGGQVEGRVGVLAEVVEGGGRLGRRRPGERLLEGGRGRLRGAAMGAPANRTKS